MKIYWYGQSCFEIRATSVDAKKKTRIVIDPYENNTGLKLPLLQADLVLITHNRDNSNIRAVKGNPFIISESGEYEVKEVFVRGMSSICSSHEEKDLDENIIYLIEVEGIKICHLGNLGQKELTVEQLENIGDSDILMLPVGGKYTIDAETAQKITNQIEPKIIIPMYYKIKGLKIDLDGVDEFLKTMGQEDLKEQEEISIKKGDLPAETKIIVLRS
jgi:L-ascorbate metabolism protein UlaG (beta-lactamase superfamily)